jgi:phosphate transport system permease protein
MSTSTATIRRTAVSTLKRGRLPGYVPWVAITGSIGVGLLIVWLVGLSGEEPSFHWGAGLLLAAVLYTALIMSLSWLAEGRRRAMDRLVTTIVSAAFIIVLIPLSSVVITALEKGLNRFDLDFFSQSLQGVLGAGGGAVHAIWGTVLMTGAAAIISIPIGLLASVYLAEYGRGTVAKAITFFVDVMTGIPSIVAGLFAFVLFQLILGPGTRIGLSGAIALSLLMIPVVVRSSEEMLRLVPNELREAAYALGVPKWLTILKVVLPTSLAGVSTGIVLAIARVVGETAPLLIAAGFAINVNLDLFHERMQSLPVFVYTQYTLQGTDAQAYLDRAWTGALVLILIVMILNLIARVVSSIFAPKSGR